MSPEATTSISLSFKSYLCKADGVPTTEIARATLFQAGAAAFATRVHLRDETEGEFVTAFNEVFELVVDRGLDPDEVLAPPSPKA